MAAQADEKEPPTKVPRLDTEEKEIKKETVQFNVERNSRNMTEYSVCGQHLSLADLKKLIEEDSTIWEQLCHLTPKKTELHNLKLKCFEEKPRILDYLDKGHFEGTIPVEFHVANVAHVTTKEAFLRIMESEEFRPPVAYQPKYTLGVPVPQSDLSWWDLKIQKEEISEAEERYLQRIEESVLKKEEEEMRKHVPFHDNITTSPLFKLDESRYGNYRFTFPLQELMKLYKEHNCDEQEPVLRVFKTIFYKQEVVYAVLVHSPENNELFSKFPPLEESAFVNYKDGKIIWRAQALSETNKYMITLDGVRKPDQHQVDYYVWDQVSLVFHVDSKKSIKVTTKELIDALEYCSLAQIQLRYRLGF